MAGTGLMSAGTVLSAYGKLREGQEAHRRARYKARLLEQNANTVQAIAQRNAIEARRAGNIKASRARAVAGYNPGVGVINTLGRIQGETDYNVQSILYEGAESARNALDQAQALRFSGRQARKAARLQAAATLLGDPTISNAVSSGAKSLFAKYGI